MHLSPLIWMQDQGRSESIAVRRRSPSSNIQPYIWYYPLEPASSLRYCSWLCVIGSEATWRESSSLPTPTIPPCTSETAVSAKRQPLWPTDDWGGPVPADFITEPDQARHRLRRHRFDEGRRASTSSNMLHATCKIIMQNSNLHCPSVH